MYRKPRVLWIADGKNWGWDIRAHAVSALLPQYRHKITYGAFRTLEEVIIEMIEFNPDIVVCNPITLVPYLPFIERTAIVLTSERLVDDYVSTSGNRSIGSLLPG